MKRLISSSKSSFSTTTIKTLPLNNKNNNIPNKIQNKLENKQNLFNLSIIHSFNSLQYRSFHYNHLNLQNINLNNLQNTNLNTLNEIKNLQNNLQNTNLNNNEIKNKINELNNLKIGILFSWSGLHERLNPTFHQKCNEIINQLNLLFNNYYNSLQSTLQNSLQNSLQSSLQQKEWIDENFIQIITKQTQPTIQTLQKKFNDCNVLLICPLTGGTEELLQNLVNLRKPVIFYGESFHNSLAAALELKNYFKNYFIPTFLFNSLQNSLQNNLQNGLQNFIVIDKCLQFQKNYKNLWREFLNLKIGLIGEISPWLINEKDFVNNFVKNIDNTQNPENDTKEIVTIPSFKFPFLKISSQELYNEFKNVNLNEVMEIVKLIKELQSQKIKRVSSCCGGGKKPVDNSVDKTSQHFIDNQPIDNNKCCNSDNIVNNNKCEMSHDHCCSISGEINTCDNNTRDNTCQQQNNKNCKDDNTLPTIQDKELIEACKVYLSIQNILTKYNLDGFTIGCFDLIKDIKTTPCLALGLLNGIELFQLKTLNKSRDDGGCDQLRDSDGSGFTTRMLKKKASACEGELNSLLGMIICQKFLKKSPFMANIIDYKTLQNDNPEYSKNGKNEMIESMDELLIAHCTAPIIPGLPFELTTHFESGMGVAVRVDLPAIQRLNDNHNQSHNQSHGQSHSHGQGNDGQNKVDRGVIKAKDLEGKVIAGLKASAAMATIFKIKPNSRDVIIAPVIVYDRETSLLRCRTQLRLKIQRVEEFIDNTFGNHHLLVYENYYNVRDLFINLGFNVIEHL